MPSSRLRIAQLGAVLLVAATAFGTSGCIKKMILDGQIEGTRKGSAAMNGTADYEVARAASSAGLAQFEGMHLLAPDNVNGYFLLVKGYTSYAFGFVEDDMEVAILDGKDELARYHKARAKSLYTRAIGFGTQWLESQHEGYAAAESSGSEDKMVAYLKSFDDASDADLLFWTGYAWMARTNVTKETALIGTLYVGKAMVQRAVQLNDAIENGSGHVVLGAYAARTGVATIGADSFTESKKQFDRANEITGGKLLMPNLQVAKTYICHGADDSPGRADSFAKYTKLLSDILAAEDPMPELRLLNAIAKRRARRYLSQAYVMKVEREDCGWDASALKFDDPEDD